MSVEGAPRIDGQTIARLARGVRMREDTTRGQMVLLAPERALALDEIAVAIIMAIDGVKTLGEIATGFSRQFEAPKDEVLDDIIAFVREFASRRMLELR